MSTSARGAAWTSQVRYIAAAAVAPTKRNILHWVSWALVLLAELSMLFVLRSGRVFEWEQDLTRAFQAVPYNNILFQVTSGATNTLSWQFMVAFTLVVALFVLARRPVAAALVFATFPLHVLAQFPKAVVDRARPSSAFEGIEGVGGAMSFPSGHSEYVVTFYGFLAYLLILRLRPRWARFTVASLWVTMVLATGFGRVAQGRHWPLDVVTSYVVGLGLLSGLVWLYSAVRLGQQHATDAQAGAIIGDGYSFEPNQ